MDYCLVYRGLWWANHFFWNREVTELYQKLRALNSDMVSIILICGCPDYEKHIRLHEETVKAIINYEKEQLDLLGAAWDVIAKAGGGDWNKESAEWREAAAEFRRKYKDKLEEFRRKYGGKPERKA